MFFLIYPSFVRIIWCGNISVNSRGDCLGSPLKMPNLHSFVWQGTVTTLKSKNGTQDNRHSSFLPANEIKTAYFCVPLPLYLDKLPLRNKNVHLTNILKEEFSKFKIKFLTYCRQNWDCMYYSKFWKVKSFKTQRFSPKFQKFSLEELSSSPLLGG